MTDRRLATFDLLARLERDRLSADAQRHAALHGAIARMDREAVSLGERIEAEAFASSAETAPYVGAFISAIRSEIEQCNARKQSLQREADALEDDMREKFRHLKTAELVAARRRLAKRSERTKREEAERLEAMMLRQMRTAGATR